MECAAVQRPHLSNNFAASKPLTSITHASDDSTDGLPPCPLVSGNLIGTCRCAQGFDFGKGSLTEQALVLCPSLALIKVVDRGSSYAIAGESRRPLKHLEPCYPLIIASRWRLQC